MLSDVTFLDAYQRTNRFLNVTVTAADTNEPPRMLNYLTAPHVVIWSAVAASSAFPGLFPPQDILARNPAGSFVGCVPFCTVLYRVAGGTDTRQARSANALCDFAAAHRHPPCSGMCSFGEMMCSVSGTLLLSDGSARSSRRCLRMGGQ